MLQHVVEDDSCRYFVAMCCSVLQCVAVCCSALQRVVEDDSCRQCGAVWCCAS